MWNLAKKSAFFAFAGWCSLALAHAQEQEDKRGARSAIPAGILKESGLLERPDLMVKQFLLAEIDAGHTNWQTRYETVKTADDVAVYSEERRAFFYRQLGPLWEKTPLNPRRTGTLEKDGFRVEKIVFESQPKFNVTGALFLPDGARFKPPYPAVLLLCGHNIEGKGAKNYQRVCGLGAINGLAMFVVDPIEQGERIQTFDGNTPRFKKRSGVAHNAIGAGSILLGRSTATFEVWDMIRALDYLQWRTDIIPNKIGVAGCSGGGTQTAYIMALDERVQAAAPSCYICSLFNALTHIGRPQDSEQNVFGQLAFGMDHADYCIMRAPLPTLICTATKDFFNAGDAWSSFRYAQRIYTRLGVPEKMAILESDGEHGYSQEHREGTIRWMLRWLAGRDERITERESQPDVAAEELRCVGTPGVISLPGARTTYDINRDLAKRLAVQRTETWKSMTPEHAQALIRRRTGIRPLGEIPRATRVYDAGNSRDFVLETEKNCFLPVRVNIPVGTREASLYVDDKGRYSDGANALFEHADKAVVSVDLRGWGETMGAEQKSSSHAPEWFGQDGSVYYLAYLCGRSFVQMRAEDLLAVARYLRDQYGVNVHLVADGSARTIALHAAAVAPECFASVVIENEATLQTWHSRVLEAPRFIELTDTVHGVLNDYDLDCLLRFVKQVQTRK